MSNFVVLAGFELDPPTAAPVPNTTTTSGNMAPGSYKYLVTYTTAFGETTPGPVTASAVVVPPIGATTGSILLTGLPSVYANYIKGRRVYRTSVGEALPYKLVTEITSPYADSYLDTLADGGLGAQPPTANTAASNEKIFGNLLLERPIIHATDPNVNATGIDRATAQDLPAKNEYVFVNTPAPNNGVVLPFINSDRIGMTCTIKNNSPTNTLLIYPQEALTSINGALPGVPYSLAGGDSVALIVLSAISWSKVIDSGSGGPPTGAAGGSLAGSYPNPSLAPSGVTAATYVFPTIQVNNAGQITSAISGSAVTSITAGTGLSGGTITGTGTISAGTELAGLSILSSNGFVRRTGAGAYTTDADPLPATHGGTGRATYAVGDVLYANALNSLTVLSKPGVDSLLQMDSAGAPSWTNKADLLAGILVKEPVTVTSIADIGGAYAIAPSNGQFTGINTTNVAAWDLGAYVIALGDRLLVKDQADPKQNGIYTVTAGPLNNATLTRSSDLDGAPANEIQIGDFTFVHEGGVNQHTSWIIHGAAGGTVLTPNVDAINWTIFATSATYTAGTGLSLAGTVFSLQTPVSVTNGGTGKTTVAQGSLLYGSAANVYGEISDGTTSQVLRGGGGTGPTFGQVSNAALVNSSLTVTAGTGLAGGGAVSLGGTVSLNLPNVGTAGTYGSATQVPVLTTDAQGRVTGVTNTAITASPSGAAGGDLTGTYPNPTVAANAITATKIATDAVTTLKILDANVTNAKLAFSSLTVNAGTGLSGGGSVSLGGSTTINMPVTGVSAATYGSATQVGTFTVDVYGRITAASNTTISGVSPVGATLPSANIWVGSGANVAAAQPMTGDVSITNAGATTVNTIQGVFIKAATGTSNLSWGVGSNNNAGSGNISFGAGAGASLTTGTGNLIFGTSADVGADSVSAIVIGNGAKNGAASATANIFIGNGAGNLTMNSQDNVGVGTSVFASLTTGLRHVAAGTRAGTNLTNATDNVLLGYEAGTSITGSFENVGVGSGALRNHVNGAQNTALGMSALRSNINGQYNVAVGWQAMTTGTAGDQNTGVGKEALRVVAANNNSAFGYEAGRSVTTGTENLLLGRQAGLAITTGIRNILVGNSTNAAANSTNSIAIGYGLTSTLDNEIMFGNSSHTYLTLGSANAIPSLPVPNNYYAQMAGVKVGGLYRSRFNGSATPTTNAITASFVAPGTTLTVTAVTTTTLAIGQVLTGGTINVGPPAIYIVAQLSGAAGDVGTYQVSQFQDAGTTCTTANSSTSNPDIIYMRTV